MRAAWILAIVPCLGCGGANSSEYAAAGGFAAAAGVMQVVESTRKTPPTPPCGQDVYGCRGASERVCTTDKNGCQVCSCERTPPNDPRSYGRDDWWH
jgi:hypothetical protein